MSKDSAELKYNGQTYDIPLVKGEEDEVAIDITNLRSKTGLITLDS